MSDPEPSVAAPSSSPPSVLASESTAAALNYAFLVHSQKTLTQNLPPRVDNKLLARQKRRRTSPEDHAILEAEYQQNPKPDKTARANIVSRVSLGEKEVQIWFQNRRQNDRRKSKPLQPHELLAPRSDSLKQPTSDDNTSAEPGSSSGAEQDDHDQDKDHATRLPENAAVRSSFESVAGDKEPEQALMSSQTSIETASSENKAHDSQPSNELHPGPESVQQHENAQPDESHPNFAKRKRSLTDLRGGGADAQQPSETTQPQFKSPPSLRLSFSFDGEAMVRKEGEMTPSPPKGRSALRIAMSSDGKAVIRGEDEPSPSKNRVSMFSTRRTRFAGGLRRSTSAVILGTPRTGVPERERTFGRSRDPRNWESVFDTDARSALSTPTSAQSAPHNETPGLFRSRSQRSLTRSLSSRQNVLANRSPDILNTPIPQHLGEKRRKLSRTVSSLGRLEGRGALASSHKNSKLFSSTKKDDEDLEQYGDSDKENWIPGTRVSNVRRRNTSHNSQRPALKEAKEGLSNKNLGQAGRRSRLPPGHQRKTNGKAVSELGPEVSAFMAGGNGASQEEDLDCIQGLLSLSQGAWK